MKECNHNYLEYGDTVYVYGESEVDISFEKIQGIKYCPLCGAELKRRGKSGSEEE